MKNNLMFKLSFNIFSYGIFALSGLLINFIIGYFYTASDLGFFNKIFAIYIALSQIAVAGQNFTVLRYSAFVSEEERNGVLTNTVIISAIISLFVSLIIFCIKDIFSMIFNGGDMILGIYIIALSLPAFSINKVLLNYLNGILEIKKFAIIRTFRMIFMNFALIIFVLNDVSGKWLPLIITFSEYFILAILLIINIKNLSWKAFSVNKCNEYFKFGLHSVPIGLIAELNTRVDVLCLSIFLDDAMVGKYSFAAMLAEGIYQLYVAVRQIINPYIVKLQKDFNYKYKDYFKKDYLLINYGLSILLGLCSCAAYIILVMAFYKDYFDTIIIFIILICGILLNSYFIILGNYFVQSGMPNQESRVAFLSLITNILLNFVSIPLIGLNGAAIATVISYFVYSFFQSYKAARLKI